MTSTFNNQKLNESSFDRGILFVTSISKADWKNDSYLVCVQPNNIWNNKSFVESVIYCYNDTVNNLLFTSLVGPGVTISVEAGYPTRIEVIGKNISVYLAFPDFSVSDVMRMINEDENASEIVNVSLVNNSSGSSQIELFYDQSFIETSSPILKWNEQILTSEFSDIIQWNNISYATGVSGSLYWNNISYLNSPKTFIWGNSVYFRDLRLNQEKFNKSSFDRGFFYVSPQDSVKWTNRNFIQTSDDCYYITSDGENRDLKFTSLVGPNVTISVYYSGTPNIFVRETVTLYSRFLHVYVDLNQDFAPYSALDIMNIINSEPEINQIISVELASGSDGSGLFEPKYNLSLTRVPGFKWLNRMFVEPYYYYMTHVGNNSDLKFISNVGEGIRIDESSYLYTTEKGDNKDLKFSSDVSASIEVVQNEILVGEYHEDETPFTYYSDYIYWNAYTAAASGTVNKIRLKALASGNVRVAIYNEKMPGSGYPADIIAQSEVVSVVGDEWSYIDIPDVAVSSGTAYCIAVASNVSISAQSGGSEHHSYSKSMSFSDIDLYGFPSTATEPMTEDTAHSAVISGFSYISETQLIGDTTTSSNGFMNASYVFITKYVATANGYANFIRFLPQDVAGYGIAAIYSSRLDEDEESMWYGEQVPDLLLSASEKIAIDTESGEYCDISIPTVELVEGTTYWIAVARDVGIGDLNIYGYDDSGFWKTWYKTIDFSTFTFPVDISAETGFDYESFQPLCGAFQVLPFVFVDGSDVLVHSLIGDTASDVITILNDADTVVTAELAEGSEGSGEFGILSKTYLTLFPLFVVETVSIRVDEAIYSRTTEYGGNKDLIYTSLVGEGVTITAGFGFDPVVEVSGKSIIVGYPTPSANNIMSLINSDPIASLIVSVSLAPGSDGSGSLSFWDLPLDEVDNYEELLVLVDSSDVSVQAPPGTTSLEIMNLINEDPSAGALMTVSLARGGDGSGSLGAISKRFLNIPSTSNIARWDTRVLTSNFESIFDWSNRMFSLISDILQWNNISYNTSDSILKWMNRMYTDPFYKVVKWNGISFVLPSTKFIWLNAAGVVWPLNDYLSVKTIQNQYIFPEIIGGQISFKDGSIAEASLELNQFIPEDSRCIFYLKGDARMFDGISRRCVRDPGGTYKVTIQEYLEILKPENGKGGHYLVKDDWHDIELRYLVSSNKPSDNNNEVGLLYMANSAIPFSFFEEYDLENNIYKWEYSGLPYSIAEVFEDHTLLTQKTRIEDLKDPSLTTQLASGGSETTIHVSDTSGFPLSGTFYIGSEAITYTGRTSGSFTGCVRAANGTTASEHVLGALVASREILMGLLTTPLVAGGTETTIYVTGAGAFPFSGTIYINGEEITYTSRTDNYFSGCNRASNGTEANSCTTGEIITHNPGVNGWYHDVENKTLYIRCINGTSPYYHTISVPNIWDFKVPLRIGNIGSLSTTVISYWETANGDVPLTTLENLLTALDLEYEAVFRNGICYIDISEKIGSGSSSSPSNYYQEGNNIISVQEIDMADARNMINGVVFTGYGSGAAGVKSGKHINMGRGGRFVLLDDSSIHDQATADGFVEKYLNDHYLPARSLKFVAPLIIGDAVDQRRIGDTAHISIPSEYLEQDLRAKEILIRLKPISQTLTFGDKLISYDDQIKAMRDASEKYRKHLQDEIEEFNWSWSENLDSTATRQKTFEITADILTVQKLVMTCTTDFHTTDTPAGDGDNSGGGGGGDCGGESQPIDNTTHHHAVVGTTAVPSATVAVAAQGHTHTYSTTSGTPSATTSVVTSVATVSVTTDCCTGVNCGKRFVTGVTGASSNTTSVASSSHTHSVSGTTSGEDSQRTVATYDHTHQINFQSGDAAAGTASFTIPDYIQQFTYKDQGGIRIDMATGRPYETPSDPAYRYKGTDVYTMFRGGGNPDLDPEMYFTVAISGPGIVGNQEVVGSPFILRISDDIGDVLIDSLVKEAGTYTVKVSAANKTNPTEKVYLRFNMSINGVLFVDTIVKS